ncbi:DUF1963 domain-containing protein [Flavobacterium pedocola]
MIFKKTPPKEKILKFITKCFSKEVALLLTENLIESVELDWDKKTPVTTGATKWGGYPDLPGDVKWPENTNGKLDFITQINLAELENYIEVLPQKGIVYIFIDLKNLFSEELPTAQKFKVIFSESTDALIPQQYKKLAHPEESRLKIIKTYSALPTDSPKFEGIEVTDDDFDNLMDLGSEIIEECVGKSGYFPVGQNINDNTLYDWSAATGKENADDYFSIFQTDLDLLNYPDCFMEIGILKKDLKHKNFENAVLGVYGT